MISRSFERPKRTAKRANDTSNRYSMRHIGPQDARASCVVSAHDHISDTHRPHQRIQTCRLTSHDTILGTHRLDESTLCSAGCRTFRAADDEILLARTEQALVGEGIVAGLNVAVIGLTGGPADHQLRPRAQGATRHRVGKATRTAAPILVPRVRQGRSAPTAVRPPA